MRPLLGEIENIRSKGRREQEGLTFFSLGRVADDALDVRDETHRQHAIRFIEHQHLDLGEIDVALLLEIQQSARGGHQDVQVLDQLFALLLVIHATDHARHVERGEARQCLGIFFDLQRQLAGGRDDQRTRRARLLAVRRLLLEEIGEHRDQEGGRLAGAGLGLAHHVAAEQRVHQRFGLDRGAVLEPFGVDGAHQRQRQIEIVEPPAAGHGRDRELIQRPAGGVARLRFTRLASTPLGSAVLCRCLGVVRLTHSYDECPNSIDDEARADMESRRSSAGARSDTAIRRRRWRQAETRRRRGQAPSVPAWVRDVASRAASPACQPRWGLLEWTA